MGSVWLAHHVGLDTPCAVKFIHSEVAAMPDIRARFEREAKAAAALRSSHVVQILDYGVWDGFPYIAMEYLEGEDLAQRIKRKGRLSLQETVLIISQVARALTKAHAAGLIHRDLKPENIFLVPEDDHEVAKVLDFGIAKTHAPVLDTATTKAGALLGTPHYMSPEQAQGTKSIDYRSDLWSLGVLAYQCLTGKLPFNSEALGDLLLHIMVNPLPIPSQIAPEVPPTFDIWWQRAAARDASQRFQSAKELSDALAVALGVTAVMAPGMVPFAPLSGSGLFVVTGTPSMPSITPPPPQLTSGPVTDPDGFNVPPTTGQGVSLDEQMMEEELAQRSAKVPLGLGVLVAVGALLAGVGIAFLGRSYLSDEGERGAAQVATAPQLIPPPPVIVHGVAPQKGSDSAATIPATSPSRTADPAVGSASSAFPGGVAPLPSGSAGKLPLKPRKPKEKDFGF
jgi:serine/threonine-protein kinase